MTIRRTNTIEPRWLLVFVFLVSGVFFGGLATYLYVYKATPPSVRLHFPKGTYTYINPTIVSEPNIRSNFSSVNNDMQLKIAGMVTEAEKQGSVTNAAVYFRDLESSKILAINANTQFSPGKLLKVPIMIAYLKLAEDNPDSLKKMIAIKDDKVANENVFTVANTSPAGDYTVDQALHAMITDDSDDAANALFDTIDKSVLNEVFSDLGIDFTEDKQTKDFISLRRYSLFLRILYNASYLSNNNSEKALSLLADATTPSLLEANLPHTVPFASRVGGRKVTLQGAQGFEVYECDIVYYPNHNYLLCVSAESAQLEDIKTFFAKVGDAIYANMDYQYGA